MTFPSNGSLCKQNSWFNSPTANDFSVKLMLHLILIYRLAALLRYVINSTHTRACRNCTAFLKGRKKGHHDSAELTKVLIEIQEKKKKKEN